MQQQFNYRHQTLAFNLQAGTTHLSERITLLQGKAIRAVIELDGDFPNQLINVGLKDSGGNRLEDATSIRNWKQRCGCDYLQSMKPINILGNQNIIVEITALQSLASDLRGQIIFIVQQEATEGQYC